MTERKKLNLCEKIAREDSELLSLSTRIRYYPLVVAKAQGAKILDADGNEYIDFLSGAATTNIGHCHPRVVKAIKEQCEKFIHNTLAYDYYEVAVELAKKLVQITPGIFPKRVAFGLTGSDSNDGAIKLARSFTGRSKIIAFLRSYHGTTYGALSISGVTLNMRRRIGPLLPEVYHVPFPDCYRCIFKLEHPSCGLQCFSYLETMLETIVPPDEVAALITEAIQGDAGVIIPPDDYVGKLTQLCRNYEILLAVDEVQTGFGRTGKWFSVDHWNLQPDILIIGKAIASGMPISALVSKKEIMEKWKAPVHLFTTQANPVSCAAAIATIDVIEEERLLERSASIGEYTRKRFREMMDKHQLIGDVRGKGLLIGVDLVKNRDTKEPAVKEVRKVDWRAWEKGVVLTHFGKSVLRIAPPLTISQDELDEALNIVEEAIDDVEKGKVSDDILDRITGW